MNRYCETDADDAHLDLLLESQLKMEDDVNGDLSLLEGLIFPDREKTFNELDHKTAANVIQAMNEAETGDKDPVFFQCANCNRVFTFELFQAHVCNYDSNGELITPNLGPENELQLNHRYVISQLDENQSALNEILQKFRGKETSSGTLECRICCRKFVHEAGLFRHWDKHIGEILKPSPAEREGYTKALPWCSICGEVQGSEVAGWLHYEHRHLNVTNSNHSTPDFEGSEVPGEESQVKIEEKSSNETSIVQENKTALASVELKKIRISKVYQCDFCDVVFASSKIMYQHVSLHSASSGYQCQGCELYNLTFKQILLHRRDDCIHFKDYRNQLKDFPRYWACNVCDEEFSGIEQLYEHRYKNHHYFPRIDYRTNELSFFCELCLVVFKTAPKLVEHFNDKHTKTPKEDVVSETSERISKPTTSRRGGSHQTSTRPRQYLCEVCGKSYTQSSHLWQHLRFHQGVKPFECSVDGCDRKFTIRPDLNDHIRKCHTGERPFLCTLCGKRFLTGSVYYQHRLIHRGERRYGCEECDKRFYRADALKNHMRIHTGEKPHLCIVCGKTFRQRGDRDKHIKARHPMAQIIPSPKRERIKSFGRGRIKNNTSLYQSMPDA